MTPEMQTIDALFPPLADESLMGQERSRAFADKWSDNLHSIVDTLTASPEPSLNHDVAVRAKEAIDIWKTHDSHGAGHSYHVYEGMVYIAQQDGVWDQAHDATFQALAVLHDLAQSFPLVHPQTGEPVAGDARILHADTMARLIMMFGQKLGIETKLRRDLMRSIRHHDDTYVTGKLFSHMSYIGGVLADADKLFASSLSREADDLVTDAMSRNLLGGGARDGWPLLRTLSQAERDDWVYGDRWFKDGLSAVIKEMVGTDYYTQTGKRLAHDKREAFFRLAPQYYTTLYRQQRDVIIQWKHAVDTSDASIKATQVGKDQAPQLLLMNTPEDVDGTIQYLSTLPLPVSRKPRDPSFVPMGWKIIVEGLSEQPFILDPSILAYPTEEAFLDALHAVLNQYTKEVI